MTGPWTLADAYELLAVAQSFDRRTVGDFDAEAWRRAMTGVDLDDAKQAVVRHYTHSTDWVMPAHVRQHEKLIRRERLEGLEVFTPDADPDDVPAYLEARRTGRVRLDEPVKARDMRALEGAFPNVPPVDVSTWRQRAQRMLPGRKALPPPMTHTQAVADMDRMLAEQAARQTVEEPTS